MRRSQGSTSNTSIIANRLSVRKRDETIFPSSVFANATFNLPFVTNHNSFDKMAGGWSSLGLLPELVQTCEEDFDWILPSAIQDEAIPLLLGGGDVMVGQPRVLNNFVASATKI